MSELSDGEKKAIEELKSFINDKDCIYWIGKNGEEAVKIILNLIENQQKEIEELKKYEEGYKLLSYGLDNYISKDKIRAKIEEYKRIEEKEIEVDTLQELLEEE